MSVMFVRYVLLTHSLGCLCGMLCAAIVEDIEDAAIHGSPSISTCLSNVFEAYLLFNHFLKVRFLSG